MSFEWLMEPLAYPMLARGMAAAVIIGVVCAVVGTFVVLKGMAFFGDALAHCMLPGVATGYLITGGATAGLFWWGLGAAVGTALAIGALTRRMGMREDTAIGILFAGMFALGIAMISRMRNYAVDLAHFLFGNILGVTPGNLLTTAIFAAAILAIIVLFYKEFVIIIFDEVLARSLRLPVTALYYLLLVLIALSIAIALQTAGLALMLAMLVTPAATAQILTRRLPWMMTLAGLLGGLSGVLGFYASYHLRIASGPAIVLVCMLFFLLAITFAPRRGRPSRA